MSLRLVILRLRPLRQKTISIINCYSLTSAADEHKLDAFREELVEALCIEKSFHKFVAEDFSARIGMAEEAEYRIGRFGFGLWNNNGNRFVWAPVRHSTFSWQLHIHEEG